MFTAIIALVLLSQVKQVDAETADYLISAAKKQLPQAIAEGKVEVIGAKKTLALAKGARGTKDEKAANVARAMDALTKAEKRLTDFQQGRALPLPNFTHTLPFKTGDFQTGFANVRVDQVVSKTECIGTWYGDSFYFRGLNTSGLADGTTYTLTGPFVATGTESYTTVLGAKRTLLLFEVVDWGAVEKRHREMSDKK